MSRGYYPNSREKVGATEEYEAEGARPSNPNPSSPEGRRHAPGTRENVQVKMNQDLYGPLKVVAGLTGKTVPELLGEIVTEAIAQYKTMTIEEILKK